MNLRGKEKYNSVNHLTGLAQCLIDRNTIIDLRNETMVAGTIVDVDGYMNVTMENAVYVDQLGRQYPLDNFMVYSKYIRYIHIPKDVKILPSFENYLSSMAGPQRGEKKKLTFREKRTKMSNLNTMMENNMTSSR
ncbi:U7 snRNA-associated Sm-like protein LSm10 [Anopheles gambiae]|uniref:Sm domain-containing protein n=1 Tax=Anopheles quadriannulatus TaxID=34691 RepID=A0A1Y9J0C4_ANOQN|nr:U7 snRNA-associated Sm-like protein LSm10 [Anopheles gambiae]